MHYVGLQGICDFDCISIYIAMSPIFRKGRREGKIYGMHHPCIIAIKLAKTKGIFGKFACDMTSLVMALRLSVRGDHKFTDILYHH